MATIIERIIQYIEYKNISKYKFYKDTGLANGFLDKNGNIGSDKCERIISQYNDINIEWLILGKGEMISNEKEFKPKYNESPPCPPPPPATTCNSCEAKDAAIQAMKTTIETQAKYIKMLEAASPTEVGQQKKQDSNVTSPHEGQKRKAVVNELTQ